MVRDRFIDGQAERALRRQLDSLGPNTPMTDIVDCCRMWERHCEVEIQPRTSANRRPGRVICQVTEVELTPAVSPETETVEDIIKKLLPTPAPPPLQVPGTGSPTKPPGPTDGKRRLIRGEGSVARISNDYRPQLPSVGKDIPEQAVPCHVRSARL